MKSFKKFIFLAFLIFFSQNFAQENLEIKPENFLLLGPIKEKLPAFSEKSEKKGYKNLFKFEQFNMQKFWPSEGEEFSHNNRNLTWKRHNSEDGSISFILPKNNNSEYYFTAFYLESARWLETKIKIKSCQFIQAYLNGEQIGSSTRIKENKSGSCSKNSISKSIELAKGKHLVLIKTQYIPVKEFDWNLKVTVELEKDYSKDDLKCTLSPVTYTDISNLLDDKKIRDVGISADGIISSVSYSKRTKSKKSTESWIELYDNTNGNLITSLRGLGKISSISWAPKGHSFAFTTRDNDNSNLWIYDFDKGESNLILEEIEDFSGFQWSDNSDFLIYSITENGKKNNGDLIKYDDLADRLPWGSNKTSLFMVDLSSGIKKAIADGPLSVSLHDVSNDGNFALISRTKKKYEERPFSETSFYLLDLNNHELDSLFTEKFVNGGTFSPDDNKLLLTGGPSVFDGIGKNIPDNVIPNDYDSQAFIYDLASREIEPITKDFAPTIQRAFWVDNFIYFVTLDKSFRHLYQYNTTTKKMSYIDLGLEYVNDVAIANNSETIAFSGSSSNVPRKAYLYDFDIDKVRLLSDPQKYEYKKIKLGKVEDFKFNNDNGKEILGRVYYPPNFDEEKKYPVIVYYYAGTSPVTREFEGRYPKNIWAANGYLVYVMQPSGCYGFGQAHSAKHVNDWGEITAREIVKGTEKLIEGFDFVDSERIGCIGASYGGFMTMNLITKTDIFAAAVSHAGISALSSYWGEGYWGYGYSAVASAESYPWNNEKLYIEHSPLFNADKINTPILLLHGNSDTNVPRGESVQMYVALKLLGKDVEFIEVKGQDHHIMDYDKRIEWTKSIISYFDWKLKGQPQWWNEEFKK